MLTSCCRSAREYSTAGRPAPGPLRPVVRPWLTWSRPASTSLSRWKAATVRGTPSAAAAWARPTGRPCAATWRYSARRRGSVSVPIAASCSSRFGTIHTDCPPPSGVATADPRSLGVDGGKRAGHRAGRALQQPGRVADAVGGGARAPGGGRGLLADDGPARRPAARDAAAGGVARRRDALLHRSVRGQGPQ